jgi:type II secretory pathway predicted ATPase ExeA
VKFLGRLNREKQMPTIEERVAILEAKIRNLSARDRTSALAIERLHDLYKTHTKTLQRILSDVEDLKVISNSVLVRLGELEQRMTSLENFLKNGLREMIKEVVLEALDSRKPN